MFFSKFIDVYVRASPLRLRRRNGRFFPADYNADVQAVAPENITLEHFVAEENTTYYTSEGLSL